MVAPAIPTAARAASHRRPARRPSSRPAPTGPLAGLSRDAERLLLALGRPGMAARLDPTRDDVVILHSPQTGISLGRGAFPLAAALELERHDLLSGSTGAAGRRAYGLTDAGQAHLRRRGSDDPETAFAAQQRDAVTAEMRDEFGTARVLVNAGESPLAWLRRRRDREGEPLIDAAAFEAGERLRRDLTLGGMLPSVTARWDGAIGGGGAGAWDPAGATDTAIAARQRVRRALDEVGGDFAGLLVDLCGFLKGLELIERERSWPPRSGKVVVRLALRGLARHYGLECEARGPERSRGLRAWQADPPPDEGPS